MTPSKGGQLLSPSNAQKRFRILLLLFVLALGMPVGFLFLHSYRQLSDEIFHQYQSEAQEVVGHITDKVFEVLAPEEKRPFDEYNFYSVSSNPLVKQQEVRFSPLAEFPPRSSFPGLIGYFQINPDGSFHSPVLPDPALGQEVQKDFSQDEYQKRLALSQRLSNLLGQGALKADEQQPSSLGWIGLKSQSVEREKSGKKLFDLNLDSRKFQEGAKEESQSFSQLLQSGDSYVRSPRKEQMNILEQEAAAPVASAPSAAAAGKALDKATVQMPQQKPSKIAPRIVTFEAEIDPFMCLTLADGNLAFFRKVWRDNSRYIQGFVVDSKKFYMEVLSSNFYRNSISTVSTLIVGQLGNEVTRFSPAQSSYGRYEYQKPELSNKPEILIFNSKLPNPLQDLEVLFTVPKLYSGVRTLFLDALAGVTIFVILVGVFMLYRLGMGQIALADQKSSFVSAVTHELKTPLTSIRMYAEMLKAGWVKDDDKKKSYFEFILSESERLSRLISNVLELSRLSNSRGTVELVEQDPWDLFDKLAIRLKTQVESAGFTFDRHVSAKPKNESHLIYASEDALTQIIINLVDNALKFSKDAQKKEVQFRFECPDGKAIFAVRDYGPGVSQDQRKKIFNLFYRAENELTRNTPGTGIGLALVRELVQKMQAKIELVDAAQLENGPGAEFQVVFDTR